LAFVDPAEPRRNWPNSQRIQNITGIGHTGNASEFEQEFNWRITCTGSKLTNNIQPCPCAARLITAGTLGILSLTSLRGDSPRLGQPVVLSNRAIEVNLSGQIGSAYTVEASTNLSNWFFGFRWHCDQRPADHPS
jgi:hypothetical protein